MPDVVFLDPDAPEAAAWDDLWHRAPQRTPFTHRGFVRAVASATGWRPLMAAVHEPDGRLSAGAVLFQRPRDLLRRAAPAPWTRYTGVLLDPVPSEGQLLQRSTALDRLLQGIAARFRVAALSLTPEHRDVRPWQWAGFSCVPHYTYRLDAGAEYRPDKPTRRRLRQMLDFEIRQVEASDEAFASLLLRHYRERSKAPPFEAPVLTSLMARLHASGLLDAVALFDDSGSRMLAAQALLRAPGAAFMWMAGSEPGPAMTVLQDHLIRQSLAEGRNVDLLGANIASIASFKSHYGGELTVHYHAVHHRSRVLRALAAVRPLA